MTAGAPEAFEEHRPTMQAMAYRMLGSAAEAEDVVQEAWLRWQAASHEAVRSVKAYLSTVVTRLCLDRLKSARANRELYVGPWLPEPIRTDTQVDPETISLAFLVLLESLSPVERAVYLLHEVFGYSHAEVAGMVEKEEAACRQILHRAREHIAARRPRFAPSKAQHERLLTCFFSACFSGDLDGLKRMLAEDVTVWADSGGKVKAAARRPIHGADSVARLYLGLVKKNHGEIVPEITEVNGWPALVLRTNGVVFNVFAIETDGERIHAIHSILNPDKLNRMQ
jgi:RNA polymerase sigma-70 factor (ECF subfamily)